MDIDLEVDNLLGIVEVIRPCPGGDSAASQQIGEVKTSGARCEAMPQDFVPQFVLVVHSFPRDRDAP